MKVYQRDFKPDNGDSLALVAKHIPENSRVLDIGCGAGDLGAYLRAEKNCYVVGIEYSEETLAVAADKLDHAIQLDLNQQMPHEVVTEQFDVIVMADILEHIYTPNQVLQSAEKCLADQGKCLISIPNSGYVGALLSLYDDEWQYREEGILDRTHIRFYTKKSVMSLLADSGFDGVICDRVIKDLTESEFTQRLDTQPDSVRDWLLAKPEGSAYQFIIEARPKAQHHSFAAETSAPTMSFQHIVKLYWQDEADLEFEANKCVIERGVMGEIGQLTFPIAANRLSKLRLDFADRRGVYRIESIRVLNHDDILFDSLNGQADMTLHAAVGDGQRLPMTCLANHEQACLLIDFAAILAGECLSVEVQLSAPVGEQNTAFFNAVPLAAYEKIQENFTQVSSDYSAFRTEVTGHIQHLENTLAHERSQLHNHQQLIESIQQEKNELILQLQGLYASSSWRLTAPFRKIINKLKS